MWDAAELWRRLADDDLPILASAIAYAAVLSVFPLLVAVIALLGLIVEPASAQESVIAPLRPYLPQDALAVVREAVAAVVRTRETAGLLAIAGLFWTATAVAGAVRHGLNRALRVPRPRPFWHRKLVDLAMVMAAGVFLSASMLTSATLAAAERLRWLAAAAEAVRHSWILAALAAGGPWLLSALAFVVVYRFVPNARAPWPGLLAGSAVAAVLFELAKRAFFWYLSTLARYPLVYGPLAGMIVFMVWIYLVAAILLVGAEVMAVAASPRPSGDPR